MLDLAAGTGKLTRELSPSGAEVVAVEPVAALRSTLAAALPSLRCVAGTAEAIPLRSSSFDAATVAQAFHWFDAPLAIEQLHRVLRSGGVLGLIWNVRDESDDLQATPSGLLAPYRQGTPSHRDRPWLDAFETTDHFSRHQRASFPHEQQLDLDGLIDRVLSISFIADLDEAEQRTVSMKVRALAPQRGRVTLPYRTDVWTCERR